MLLLDLFLLLIILQKMNSKLRRPFGQRELDTVLSAEKFVQQLEHATYRAMCKYLLGALRAPPYAVSAALRAASELRLAGQVFGGSSARCATAQNAVQPTHQT